MYIGFSICRSLKGSRHKRYPSIYRRQVDIFKETSRGLASVETQDDILEKSGATERAI